jgi:hypothetical protein
VSLVVEDASRIFFAIFLILSATGFIFSFYLARMIGFCLIPSYPKPLSSFLIRSSHAMSATFDIAIIGKHAIKVLYYTQ